MLTVVIGLLIPLFRGDLYYLFGGPWPLIRNGDAWEALYSAMLS